MRPNQLLAGVAAGRADSPTRAMQPRRRPWELRSTPARPARDAARAPARSRPPSRAYRGLHRGGAPAERDGAYHQGTVWPWLIGPYADSGAPARTSGTEARSLLAGIVAHLGDWGLGSVCETADGDGAAHGRAGARSRRGRSRRRSGGAPRRERVQLVLPLLDDAAARLRHLVPRPGRSPSGSETTSRDSSERSCRTGLSGYWCRSVCTSVL